MSGDTGLARMEGIMMGALLMILVFHFAGCTTKKEVDALKVELSTAQDDIHALSMNAKHTQGMFEVCKEDLRSTKESLSTACGLADVYVHQVMEYPYTGTTSYVEIPCATSIPILVKLHEVDLINEWVYLAYELGGEQRFSGPLPWGSGFLKDRNTLRIHIPKSDENIFVSVQTCESKTSCNLSCFAFSPPEGHATVCD